jgi:hypothetical protein
MVINHIAEQQNTAFSKTEFTSHRNGLSMSGTAITLQSYTSAVGPQYVAYDSQSVALIITNSIQ